MRLILYSLFYIAFVTIDTGCQPSVSASAAPVQNGGKSGPAEQTPPSDQTAQPPPPKPKVEQEFLLSGTWKGQGKIQNDSIAVLRYQNSLKRDKELDCSIKFKIVVQKDSESTTTVSFVWQEFSVSETPSWYRPIPSMTLFRDLFKVPIDSTEWRLSTKFGKFNKIRPRQNSSDILYRYSSGTRYETFQPDGWYGVNPPPNSYSSGESDLALIFSSENNQVEGSFSITAYGPSANIYLAACEDMIFTKVIEPQEAPDKQPK